MAKSPSQYPVWQRFPTRIAAALLAAFSLASLPPIGEWSTSLCDCKAREFLAMIPFAYNDAGAATPDVFEKVTLAAGAKTTVTFDLEDRAFSIWDADLHAWSKVHGSFGVRVGASSRDVRLTGSTAI